MATILIVEDDPDLQRIVRDYLLNAGYSVIQATRGVEGQSLWRTRHPDLVILDLNLPGLDGLEVARVIRKEDETPIIMLTARIEETDRLIGLELGADDYIPKPFSPREVVARVKAVLRRTAASGTATQKILKLDALTINLEEHTVTLKDTFKDLTPTEFNILVMLAAKPGRVFSRLQLLESIQGITFEGYERTVDAHIKNLRAKIEDDPRHPARIETVFGVGYRFHKE
jgi:two-component system, OmpR family, alkaline phosphatase synthesis response regulator PhoP